MSKRPSCYSILEIELKILSEMSLKVQINLSKCNSKIFILPKDKIIYDKPLELIFLLNQYFIAAF